MTRHDYYGVPLWLMKEYLAELGGVEGAENIIDGQDWRAIVGKATPHHVGSLVVGGTTVEFSGDEAALTALFAALHKKTLRGGG